MSEFKLIVCEVCGKEWPDHLYYDCPFCFEEEDDRIFEQRVLRRMEEDSNLNPPEPKKLNDRVQGSRIRSRHDFRCGCRLDPEGK